MSETPIQPTERKIEDTLAQLAKALDLHQEAAIADALDLYLAKPERQVGINPTSQYAEVIQAFRRAGWPATLFSNASSPASPQSAR